VEHKLFAKMDDPAFLESMQRDTRRREWVDQRLSMSAKNDKLVAKPQVDGCIPNLAS
jgi:hypothetical protein